jgi:hypothetical protein
MNYYDALKRSGKILEAYFEQSKDILHSGSKGTIRENILNKVIRPFLPSCYGLSGGEAFDKNGSVSKQLDLVVYDNVFSYLIPYIDNYIQFPCESIYGNIEIKSYLNQAEFIGSIENIQSLKKLNRDGTHSWTVTPQVQITVAGLPNDTGRNPYFGIIFAYDSVEVETVLGYFRDVHIPANLLPNAIVLYSKQTIIIHCKDGQVEIFPCNDFNKYKALKCGDDTLALFIGLLINFTRYSLLKAADIPNETLRLFQNLLAQNMGAETEISINRP